MLNMPVDLDREESNTNPFLFVHPTRLNSRDSSRHSSVDAPVRYTVVTDSTNVWHPAEPTLRPSMHLSRLDGSNEAHLSEKAGGTHGEAGAIIPSEYSARKGFRKRWA